MTRANNGGDKDACPQITSDSSDQDETQTKIRELNDSFRTTFTGGRVMLTAGILHLGSEAISVITQRVRQFDNFTEENDPYGEHDFGSIKHAGQAIFWKIEYYDNNLVNGSNAPENEEITTRILTIMLASEY